MQLGATVGLTLTTGTATVLVMLLRGLLTRTTLIPPLVGYIVMGFILRLVDDEYGLLPEQWDSVLFFLAQLGVVALLFRVGLTSNLKKLKGQLPAALPTALCGLAVSGLAAFAISYTLLGFGLIPSLLAGAAFMATSVGVSVTVLEQRGRLDSDEGALVTDVAELDDIMTILAMALAFALVPILHGGGDIWAELGGRSLSFALRFAGFAVACMGFSMFLERPIMNFSRRNETSPGPMLTAIGLGLIIASGAEALGFSLAVGAFFAGLAFSRDPETVRQEANLEPLYEFLAPFFFIHIGFEVNPEAVFGALWIAAVLVVVGSVSKLLANGLPVWILRDAPTGMLVGLSMIPRAEIAMIVMSGGRSMGEWAVPEELYAGAVSAALITCILGPLAVSLQLRHFRR